MKDILSFAGVSVMCLAGLSLAISVQDYSNLDWGGVHNIHTYGNIPGTVFYNTRDLRIEGPGVWFTHENQQKFVSGNFWIEPVVKTPN